MNFDPYDDREPEPRASAFLVFVSTVALVVLLPFVFIAAAYALIAGAVGYVKQALFGRR